MSVARYLYASLILAYACLYVCGQAVLSGSANFVLPIRNFTTADGLPHNNINRIFQDTKGYLWIATDEGLSRFDGYTFENYGRGHGLGTSFISDIVADREGRLWVAVNDGGIARFLDEPGQRSSEDKFVRYSISSDAKSNNVNRIIFDSENRMWCATEAGVFRARETEVRDRDFEFIETASENPASRSATIDSRGRLWFGRFGSLVMVDGTQRKYVSSGLDTGAFIEALAEDQSGRIFAATSSAIYGLNEPDGHWVKIDLTIAKESSIRDIERANDGGLWIGTTAGLVHYRDGLQQAYSTENGLASNNVTVVYSDRAGSLWLGTFDGGLSNRTNNSIVNFPVGKAGLTSAPVRLMPDADGSIYVQIGCAPETTRLVRVYDDLVLPIAFTGVSTGSCGRNYFHRARDRRWWLNSPAGLRITDRPGSSGSSVHLPDGQIVENYLDLYEDRDGRLWLSSGDRNLYVSQPFRGEPQFELVAKDIGANLMLRDSRGTLWLANNTFLGRLRDGVVEQINEIEGIEKIEPRSLFEDSRGRIWIGTRFDGVLYTDDPGAAIPRFRRISAGNGLASNAVWTIAEDTTRAIYFGTGRGVDTYDPRTGNLRHFTTGDGVPEVTIRSIRKDLAGRIWVASVRGLTRIDPDDLNGKSEAPAVFISRVTIEGDRVPLPETGGTDIISTDLSADQNNLAVQFVSPSPGREHALRYRYKLEGYDKDWSEPSIQRDLNFANLGAGTYRLLVKAVDQRGVESEEPAVLQFRILPPVWLRWWFLTLVAVGVASLLFALYRYRVSRAIELERVRTRIATDLHDDIGSNLTRIALMSEVLNQQQGQNGSARTMLPSIANIARESVASMNDIVWAISPEHDRVLDLTRRMRQHAEEVFTIRDIDVTFLSDAADSELKLPIGVRRDVLLIFKEAVNNAARHSGCSKVEIEFVCVNGVLNLRISDNGRGFEATEDVDGHGLASMSRRAEALGGRLTIDHSGGTTVKLEMPI